MFHSSLSKITGTFLYRLLVSPQGAFAGWVVMVSEKAAELSQEQWYS
jgi:hypothetical protein